MLHLTIPKGQDIWVTADPHLGHSKVIFWSGRPPLSMARHTELLQDLSLRVTTEEVREHDQLLLERMRACASPSSVLIVAGDLTLKGEATYSRFLEECGFAKENVYLCVGNHDKEDVAKRVFHPGNVADRILLDSEGPGGHRQALIDHFPLEGWGPKTAFHLHGHNHMTRSEVLATANDSLPRLNVGVDGHYYKPWNFWEEIVPWMSRKPARVVASPLPSETQYAEKTLAEHLLGKKATVGWTGKELVIYQSGELAEEILRLTQSGWQGLPVKCVSMQSWAPAEASA